MINKEIIRKIFHMLFGIFFILIIYFLGTQISLYIISTIFIIGLIFSLLHKNGIKIPLFENIIFSVEREHEKHLPGKAALMFFLAAIIVLYFFKDYQLIVLASLAVQIFADSAAAIIGKRFGKHVIFSKNHYKKTIEGTLACLVVATIVLFIFFPIEIAIIGAIIATIIEFAPINDNLTIPIVLAFVLKIVL